jgi:beta-phosphoglucomutase family hydrolase
MQREQFKGVIFDLDGVITRTARVHALAWEATFNEFLERYAEREDKPYLPFDKSDDYSQHVDGKPRMEGVKAFLESRGIQLPFGSMDDEPGKETICGLGNQKNRFFRNLLEKEGPEVFKTSIAFVRQLKQKSVRVGVASSSRNCRLILELAGLVELFETIVDGNTSDELQLRGKPDPDIFVVAAHNLGLLPGQCVVVEDAIAGVQAGKRGNFGLVLGVARNIKGQLLKRFGADKVVQDLGEISIPEIEQWFHQGLEDDAWVLSYDGFDPGDEKLRETLTTVGNGYLGTRGCFEGERASFSFYPGTYMAGVYNKVPSVIHGRTLYNNDLVNCPNWLPIEFKIGSGEFVSPLSLEMLSYRQVLRMREGVMERTIVCQDGFGRLTRVHSRRLASMADPHLCALQYRITPINYAETVTVRSSLDGNVINSNVPRYKELNPEHLDLVDAGETPDGVFLHVKTNSSGYHVVMDAKTHVYEENRALAPARKLFRHDAEIGEEMSFAVRENHTYTVEKLVSVYTSLDELGDGIESPRQAAALRLDKARTFQGVFTPHARAWQALWDKLDIDVSGDRFVQQTIRLHIYHLLVTASPNNADLDAGLLARGLHGESYRGHIFWDEVYVMPFYDFHLPEVARALLMYRYRRLDAARDYARENGYSGAMFPWQTADDGTEETQELHYNPEADAWGPDLSRRQRHVSIAVFYNVWQHVLLSADQAFLRRYGAELMLEIARFWSSITTWDESTGRYHIEGVMGPDEFHEKLPGAKEPGLKDNAYTNIMVVWLLERSLELLDELPASTLEHLRETGFDPAEAERWRDITRKMNVIITGDGIISQFDGYMDLLELDWDAYRKRYYSIHRMDRILKAEGDSPDRYKVAKQADVLMTYYLLDPHEVKRILEQLGYEVGDAVELLRRNYEYYEQRTSHGSTLSKIVHSVITCHIHGCQAAWKWFTDAMESDVYDTQGGTTTEGIHSGVMAGTVDMVTRYFAGVDLSGEEVVVDPNLPRHWSRLEFRVCRRKIWYHFVLTPRAVRVSVRGRVRKPVTVLVRDTALSLLPGEEKEVELA